MRRFLLILCLLNFGSVYGQNFPYPKIDASGKNITDFIPHNWTLLDSARGDLNNDRSNDLAFIIQYRDSISLIKTGNDFSDTVTTQPRILIISFYDPGTKQYKLIEQNNTFILNHDNPNMEEPFQDISISKGVLIIDFHIFMNMGGWGMSNNTYKFRYKKKDFLLIGANYNSTNRASGETEDRSYNFRSKRVKISIGNIATDKQKIEWRNFQIEKLKTLKNFIQPFTWEVEKNYYL